VRLVLFDIDGTLLSAAGAGRRAIHSALTQIFGTTGPADYWFDGKTDRQIVRELMRADGHADALIDARMAELLARYVECLHEELRDPAHVAHAYPGVHELLDELSKRGDVVLGLLTGNLAAGANAKLCAAGIEPSRFRIGAFGSDQECRPDLPAVAQRRARELLGVDVTGQALVVVGDTPADIECGRGVGARTIGVATGRYSVTDLMRHGANAVFKDFRDTEVVVSGLLGG
jgi:phosphoglycolate phosphatase-like HAD superfamily hydrolase